MTTRTPAAPHVLAQGERASGVLLHLTSLPGPYGSGDMSEHAYRFVDWLARAGQGLWQVLPLNPVGPGGSPYMSPSSFGLDPALVDPDALVRAGWLPEARLADAVRDACADAPHAAFDGARIDAARVRGFRAGVLADAARGFFAGASSGEARDEFDAFCAEQAAWLDDHALFMALSDAHPGRWQDWPRALATREPGTLEHARAALAEAIRLHRFAQWVAHGQWRALRRYANEQGVRIVGDVPIFVAPHSADVWANPQLFDLDEATREPRVVAGVPPDYFSETGQLWGNPLYRWDVHREQAFDWWLRRVRALLAQADVVRIDHFRGFCAYWEVPAGAPDARGGCWREAPGAALFERLAEALGADGPLPIIAEDLGTITPDVHALRERFRVPGMRVLQFAFGDDANNPYLPHNYAPDTVVYTGTHDNDTTLGWYAQAPEREQRFARAWLGGDGDRMGWRMMHAASQSVARYAIYPLQDVLELGSEARMNRPGASDGCWDWRFGWDQLRPWHAEHLRRMAAAHGRNGVPHMV